VTHVRPESDVFIEAVTTVDVIEFRPTTVLHQLGPWLSRLYDGYL